MSSRSSLEGKLTFLITFFLVFELLSHNALNKLKKTSNKQKVKFFLIGIHFMQGWTATTTHGVTRKRSTKR